MAGRKLTIRSRAKASTILEVVVSMVIIILVFGTALMIYANVSRLSLSVQKIRAEAVLQQTLQNIENAGVNPEAPIAAGDIRVEKEIKPYGTDGTLSLVHLTAYDNNQQKVAELQKVILNSNE